MRTDVWRVNEQGEKVKLIAWVSLNEDRLCWTHQNGYSDRQAATEVHYRKILKDYASRSDIILEENSQCA